MALSLRQIRRRIKSVENTKKITRAMEMVAAAKLKRLQGLLAESDRYGVELRRMLTNLLKNRAVTHPLLQKREEEKRILAFLITSDTGLCGSYNTNMISRAMQFIEDVNTPSPSPLPSGERGGVRAEKSISFVAIGRNGAAFLKRSKQTLAKEIPIPRPQQIDEIIAQITQIATDAFIKNETDEVIFLYTRVQTLSTLKPESLRLLPLVESPSPSPLPLKGGEGKSEGVDSSSVDYLIEPNLDQVLGRLLPEFIESEIGKCVKHSLVSEQVSRMIAMRQATDNAKEMIDSLTLARNKARQASITKELIEVVSGSRALQMK